MKWSLRTLPTAFALLGACANGKGAESQSESGEGRELDRAEMIEHQLETRGVSDPVVLEALRAVPRERFVPADLAQHAYADSPLPIGHGQTISQPYVVAYMTEAARVQPGDRVLEIGTGSGYQAAVLAEIVGELWTIEIVPELAREASATLRACGYDRVHVQSGDGYRGWPEEAPFDVILVTAAPDHVPAPLLEQLAVGGRLVLPVGGEEQEIVRVVRDESGWNYETLLPVRFVPMTGEAMGE